jgi:hypothetical protein
MAIRFDNVITRRYREPGGSADLSDCNSEYVTVFFVLEHHLNISQVRRCCSAIRAR